MDSTGVPAPVVSEIPAPVMEPLKQENSAPVAPLTQAMPQAVPTTTNNVVGGDAFQNYLLQQAQAMQQQTVTTQPNCSTSKSLESSPQTRTLRPLMSLALRQAPTSVPAAVPQMQATGANPMQQMQQLNPQNLQQLYAMQMQNFSMQPAMQMPFQQPAVTQPQEPDPPKVEYIEVPVGPLMPSEV